MQSVLIPNGYIRIPHWLMGRPDTSPAAATVLSNMAYYGYTLDKDALTSLASLSDVEIAGWWKEVQPVFADLTAENRSMGDHIVYKNFPREVLELSRAVQIFHQILIYWGMPYDALRETEEAREPLGDISRLKVLAKAGDGTLSQIYQNLMTMNNRWSDNQTKWANDLYIGQAIDLDAYGFKENGISIIAKHIFGDMKPTVSITTATDVLRLVAALSDEDISLRTTVVMRAFKRSERRVLLGFLDACRNLREDAAQRPEQFKRLFERLRPGDYKFENVKQAQDDLYNGRLKSFNAKVDPQEPTREVLRIAAERPGEYLRRFHHFYDLFGLEALTQLLPLLPRYTVRQLASFRKYVATINDRKTLMIAPRGNWTRAKVLENTKKKFAPEHVVLIDTMIANELGVRFEKAFPEGIALDPRTKDIKLQTNDQKLAEYGRGTVFDIPPEMKFLRSASFWEYPGSSTYVWYDNGWNFFDADWKGMGTCGWDNQHFSNNAAIMSGDPTNISDMKGRACQMIDLYLDRLAELGVRYAVWNILCYSDKPFSEANEVLATLQWGEDAQKGKTYEPSRAQMVFPLKSDAKTSYVAYVDVEKRKLVYMDAPLAACTRNTISNTPTMERVMPAYVEYLDSLPSMYDVLRDVPAGSLPVQYTDFDAAIEEPRAFVFKPENSATKTQRMTISDFMDIEC